MKWYAMLAVGLVVAAMPATAMGMWADVPLEVIVQRCELVIVAKVTASADAGKMKLTIPGMKQPIETRFTRYTVRIEQVLRQEGAADGNSAKGAAVEVLAQAPPRAVGGGLIAMEDHSVTLRVGQRYVLALRSLPDRPGYYLPAYPKNWASVSAERIALYKKAAEWKAWPWSKAVDGLQIALLHANTKLRIRTTFVRKPGGPPRGVRQQAVFLQPVVVLRNDSNAPIAVSLHPEDRFLTIRATGPGGKAVDVDLYSALARMDLRKFGAWSTRKIEPGKLLFINAFGEVNYASGHNVALAPGAWKLQAGYAAKRKSVKSDAPGGGDQKLWTGKVLSLPVPIEVEPPRR